MANITLLTDFGLLDASAGAVRGVLLSAIPGAGITDISHEIPPFDIKQGAYLLGTAHNYFAAGTTHLVIIDVYYSAAPKLLLCSHGGHYFLAPDNGIIPLALGTIPEHAWLCFELTAGRSFGDWTNAAANVIKLLQSLTPADAGMQPYTISSVEHVVATTATNEAICKILFIDHYGNVVTDMTATQFNGLNKSGRFTIRFMRVNEITAISNHYGAVAAGDSLCRFNRSGYLEICVNQGNASSLFGFRASGKHNDIKITFE